MMDKRLFFSDFVERDGKIYGCSCNMNMICEIDTVTKMARRLYSFDTAKCISNALVARVLDCDGRIIFTPLNANKIILYNYQNSTITEVMLRENTDEMLFVEACEDYYNQCVFLFGYEYPAILKLDIITSLFEFIPIRNDDHPDIGYERQGVNGFYFGRGCLLNKKKFFLVSGKNKTICCFDTEKCSPEYIMINNGFKNYRTISMYNDSILLTSRKREKSIILLDLNTLAERRLNTSYMALWHTPIVYRNDIYLFPENAGSHILQITGENYECHVFSELDKLLAGYSNYNSGVISVKLYGDKVIFIREADKCWITYDFISNTVEEAYYEIQDEDFYKRYESERFDEVYKDMSLRKEFFDERILPLEEYIKRI